MFGRKKGESVSVLVCFSSKINEKNEVKRCADGYN